MEKDDKMDDKLTPDYIEIHDTRVEQITISINGNMHIDIKHLPVYLKIENSKYDIWSYRAIFEFEGLQLLNITGTISDWIVDGELFDLENKRVHLSTVNDCNNARKLILRFNNGSQMEIQMQKMNLVVQEAIKKTDEWVGSL